MVCFVMSIFFPHLQVNRVKDQAVSREEALQSKILQLEVEKSRRDNEFKLLRRSKLIVSIVLEHQTGLMYNRRHVNISLN